MKARTAKPAKPLRVCNWGKPVRNFKYFVDFKKEANKNFAVRLEYSPELYKKISKMPKI